MLTVPQASLGGSAAGQTLQARPTSHIRIRLWGERVGESWQYWASLRQAFGGTVFYGPASWWLIRQVVLELQALQGPMASRAFQRLCLLLGSAAVPSLVGQPYPSSTQRGQQPPMATVVPTAMVAESQTSQRG